MSLSLLKLTPEEWRMSARDAHVAAFDEMPPEGYDNIDAALLVINTIVDKPIVYITVKDLGGGEVYLKHGGAFDLAKNSTWAFSAYRLAIAHLSESYNKMSTLVHNTNIKYLKMALSVGFKVTGMKVVEGNTLLELTMRGD